MLTRELSFCSGLLGAFALLGASLGGCDTSRVAAGASGALTSERPSTGVRFGTARCDQCLAAHCNPYRGSIQALAECADAACEKSFACFQRSHCATNVDTVNQCYCGKGVSDEKCLEDNFKPHGACTDLVHKALKTTDPRVAIGLLYATDTSMGDGAALFQCAAELCTQECVLDSTIPSLGN